MAAHATHKILARVSGQSRVDVGDVIVTKPETAFMHDMYPQIIDFFSDICQKAGVPDRLFDADRFVVFLDHYSPPPNQVAANAQKKVRDFGFAQGVKHLYDNDGICHRVLPETGRVWPGSYIVGGDSHTCTTGAFGALAVTADATELATVMATGEFWMRVPAVIRINLRGALRPGVMAKDVILFLFRKDQIGLGGGMNAVIEFAGPAIASLDMDARMTLCNMTWDLGGETGYIAADERTMAFLPPEAGSAARFEQTDDGFQFAKILDVDLSSIPPMVAVPSGLGSDNIKPVQEVAGTPFHQGWIGSCTNGGIEDMSIAAKILKGRKIAKGIKPLIIPSTRQVYLKALESGFIQTFIEAGAIVGNQGCGPCVGLHMGQLADKEVCLSASMRNMQGRLGSESSTIYLASPATIAASMVTGKITDPRDFIKE